MEKYNKILKELNDKLSELIETRQNNPDTRYTDDIILGYAACILEVRKKFKENGFIE